MDVLNSVENLLKEFLSVIFFQLQSLLLADVVEETSSRPEIHDQAVEVPEGADLVEREDVGVLQLLHDPGLSVEILLGVGVFDLVHADDLDGHLLLENQMFGQLNFAEGAFTETGTEELVVTNLRQFSSLLRILKGKFCKINH